MRCVLGQVPILANAHFSALEFQQVSWRKLVNPLESRGWIRNVPQIHVLQQCGTMDLGQLRRHRQDGLDLGSEIQSSAMEGIMHRLLPQPISSDQ